MAKKIDVDTSAIFGCIYDAVTEYSEVERSKYGELPKLVVDAIVECTYLLQEAITSSEEEISEICEHCKYLGRVIDRKIRGNGWHDTTYHMCTKITTSSSELINMFPSGKKAIARSSKDGYSVFCVEKDFGCNFWERRK